MLGNVRLAGAVQKGIVILTYAQLKRFFHCLQLVQWINKPVLYSLLHLH